MNKPHPIIKYEVLCNVNVLSLEYIFSFLNSVDLRKEYYDKGIESAKQFMQENAC